MMNERQIALSNSSFRIPQFLSASLQPRVAQGARFGRGVLVFLDSISCALLLRGREREFERDVLAVAEYDERDARRARGVECREPVGGGHAFIADGDEHIADFQSGSVSGGRLLYG